ncbi:hypothetical protein [Alteromonas sp. KUL49]|uniref:hypothetical protein n=1 Tax=Alteromonas sp. KUL49 TaxID=2480798 RepID=UPI00102F145B|nr:hypothetical protein [Alteromonas sp. KUL49]TAP34991.1 hypothetical protein EYS00_18745 [Alteromonas sp. KUL49]GEA13434.1 hypothetical protein KUL49_38090 [Alteromonas sp. KUL49]
MELESGLVAAQNALVVNPPVREPQREEVNRQQEQNRQTTEYPRTQVVVRQSAEAFEQADQFQRQNNVSYDQQSNFKARRALDAYASLEREERREELQQILGVDTYV